MTIGSTFTRDKSGSISPTYSNLTQEELDQYPVKLLGLFDLRSWAECMKRWHFGAGDQFSES